MQNLKENCEGVAPRREIMLNYYNMGVFLVFWDLIILYTRNIIKVPLRPNLLRKSFIGPKANIPPPFLPLKDWVASASPILFHAPSWRKF